MTTSIKKKQKLTQEWRTLIRRNLKNGLPFQNIVAFLIKKDFDPIYAMHAVQILKDEMDTEYVYETPRYPHTNDFIQTSDRRIYIRAKFEKPTIVILDNVIASEECEELISISKDKLTRNEIAGEKIDPARTSHGTTFKRGKNELLKRLETRFSEIMNWPMDLAEPLQIIHYKPGDEYKPHFDYFPPEKQVSAAYLEEGGQRVSTLVVYLNDVEEGGATTFPSIGLSVPPKRGSAVYFEYYNSLGQLDPLTLHAGTPISKGEKWIVTQWMRTGN